ncbi:hypothetical protein V2I01_14790 [Micromonospora sp. BRA006-A]|nr:hypothetical protein [Micromonospora sp. BRA006-A]
MEVEATRTGTTTVLPATAEQPVGVDPAAVDAEPIAKAGRDTPEVDAGRPHPPPRRARGARCGVRRGRAGRRYGEAGSRRNPGPGRVGARRRVRRSGSR